MLVAGLILVFAPLRKLTLGSKAPEPGIHAAAPLMQGAHNDAASPDVVPPPSPAVATGPEAEMPASDAGASAPIQVADAADAGVVDGDLEVAQVATDVAQREFVDAAVGVQQPPPPVVFCGLVPCAPGKVCCNPSCGVCTDPGQDCSHAPCLSSTTPVSIYCGPNTCNVGQVCCNVSCGTCVSPGQTCDQKQCDNAPTIPISFTCGMATCNVGMVCCNASCGICAPPGQACSSENLRLSAG